MFSRQLCCINSIAMLLICVTASADDLHSKNNISTTESTLITARTLIAQNTDPVSPTAQPAQATKRSSKALRQKSEDLRQPKNPLRPLQAVYREAQTSHPLPHRSSRLRVPSH